MSDFDDIYERHAAAVLRFAWRLVGRRDIAEEIAAESFLALHERLHTIVLSELPAWLFTVARHRAIDYWRRRALEERFMNTLPAEPLATPVQSEELGLFEHASLKPVHRLCLRLRYGYGMSVAEVARATGLSETQAKGYLQYARQLLRKELLEEPR